MSKTFIGRWLPIAGVVLAVAFYFGYQQFDTWRTTQKFTNLERDIDVLITELQKQGITEVTKSKYCLRDGEKFGGGQLRCSIILSSTLKGENNDMEIVFDKSVKSLSDSGFVKGSEMDKQERIIYVPYANNNFTCRLTLTKESSENTQFEFYCIDAVNKPVYPVME